MTSLLWASLLAFIIDRRLLMASVFLGVAATFTLFGVIHSPLVGSPMYLPWNLDTTALDSVLRFTLGYGFSALLLIGLHFYLKATQSSNIDSNVESNDAETHS